MSKFLSRLSLQITVMVLTKDLILPSEEELTVQEVEISTPGLRAAAFHMGKACENANNVRQIFKTRIFR